MAIAVRPQALRSCPDDFPPENRTLGWQVLAWTADYLQQPDGPAAGRPWEYTLEQARLLLRWYQIDDNGRFVYRRGVIRRMKGWGKDPFAAALEAVELCGPCRFDGWDADGQPVAVPHTAPWIQNMAVDLDQNTNIMSLFPGLFTAKCIDEYKVDIGKEIIHARDGRGRIQAVTSSARSKEGGRVTLALANETQHWLPNMGGPALMAVATRNLAKSRDGSARLLEITNAHLVDEGSVAEASYEGWRQSDGAPTDVLYDAAEAPPVLDAEGNHLPLPLWSDEQVRDALIAARGDSTWLDVDRLVAEIRDPTVSESHSRRFFFNQIWAASNEEALPVGAWAACERRVGPPPDGSDIMLAIDGSYNDDSTGVVLATLTDPVYLDVVGCFEPDPTSRNVEAQTVDIDAVERLIRESCRRWRVRGIFFDPYRWARSMQALAREGLPVMEFPQSPERMIVAWQRFQTAVVNGTLTHSGDPRLARHVGNMVLRESSRGARIVKETKWSPRKVDLAIAAIMSHDRAADKPSGQGNAWLVMMRNELGKQQEETSVTPPTPPQTRPADYFGGGQEGLRSTPKCAHRWMTRGDGVDQCARCGEVR